uniref:FAD-binding PCMH-type domain-containing protein n=1 Tax=Pelodiscus sinensis TaxID=13735 RepID=K7F6U8_PELSI
MISTYEPSSKKIKHYPANSCLLPICSLHGSAVTTVEGVGSTKTRVHPIQERLAKCHGSQCGFCTPGMVMSMYALLRNHPEPSMEQIIAALDGNLCRCTGYRPIIDTYKSFAGEGTCCQLRGTGQCCLDKEDMCKSTDKGNQTHSDLCNPEKFQPVDPTQEFIFPPELMRMAQEEPKRTLVFHGKRTTWISPANLQELLELKAMYPKAPLIVGNTSVGLEMKLNGVHYPVIIHPTRIPDLHVVSNTNHGLVIGAACCLAQLRDILMKVVLELPEEKTKIFHALLQQLKTLAGEQIRSLAVCFQ